MASKTVDKSASYATSEKLKGRADLLSMQAEKIISRFKTLEEKHVSVNDPSMSAVQERIQKIREELQSDSVKNKIAGQAIYDLGHIPMNPVEKNSLDEAIKNNVETAKQERSLGTVEIDKISEMIEDAENSNYDKVKGVVIDSFPNYGEGLVNRYVNIKAKEIVLRKLADANDAMSDGNTEKAKAILGVSVSEVKSDLLSFTDSKRTIEDVRSEHGNGERSEAPHANSTEENTITEEERIGPEDRRVGDRRRDYTPAETQVEGIVTKQWLNHAREYYYGTSKSSGIDSWLELDDENREKIDRLFKKLEDDYSLETAIELCKEINSRRIEHLVDLGQMDILRSREMLAKIDNAKDEKQLLMVTRELLVDHINIHKYKVIEELYADKETVALFREQDELRAMLHSSNDDKVREQIEKALEQKDKQIKAASAQKSSGKTIQRDPDFHQLIEYLNLMYGLHQTGEYDKNPDGVWRALYTVMYRAYVTNKLSNPIDTEATPPPLSTDIPTDENRSNRYDLGATPPPLSTDTPNEEDRLSRPIAVQKTGEA